MVKELEEAEEAAEVLEDLGYVVLNKKEAVGTMIALTLLGAILGAGVTAYAFNYFEEKRLEK